MRRLAAILLVCVAPARGPAAPGLHVETPEVDLGRKESRTAMHAFVVENRGDSPLVLSNALVESGSTHAQACLPADAIPPGGRARVSVSVDLSAVTDRFDEAFTVLSNDPATPRLRLRVSGQAVASARPALEVEPEQLQFAASDEEQWRIVFVGQTTRPPVSVVDIVAPAPTMRCVVTRDRGDQSYRIRVVATRLGGIEGDIGDLVIRTDGRTPDIRIPVYVASEQAHGS